MARVSHMRRLSRVLLYMLISGLVVWSGVREWLSFELNLRQEGQVVEGCVLWASSWLGS